MLSFGRRNSKDGVVEAGPASMKAVDLGIKDGRDGKDEGQSSSPIVIRRSSAQAIAGASKIASPTVDGLTLSHSMLVSHLPVYIHFFHFSFL